MSYFQNPFAEEFRGNWVLADRQLSLTFICPVNAGRGSDSVMSWAEDNYDLSGNDADGNPKANLILIFAMGGLGFKNWAEISVSVSGATATSTTAYEVVTALNANVNFASYFVASVVSATAVSKKRVLIKQKQPVSNLKFYVKNGGAEAELRFNARAGVAELPTYFMRHSVGDAYRNVFSDAQNMLVYLNPDTWSSLGDTVDGDVVYLATDSKGNSLNFDPTTVQADWQLLRGRSGLFMFYKTLWDSNTPPRIITQIQYQAGAGVGDLAKKIENHYTGTDTTPDQTTEIPYTLTVSDLVTPP
jgi:hypothetical protein